MRKLSMPRYLTRKRLLLGVALLAVLVLLAVFILQMLTSLTPTPMLTAPALTQKTCVVLVSRQQVLFVQENYYTTGGMVLTVTSPTGQIQVQTALSADIMVLSLPKAADANVELLLRGAGGRAIASAFLPNTMYAGVNLCIWRTGGLITQIEGAAWNNDMTHSEVSLWLGNNRLTPISGRRIGGIVRYIPEKPLVSCGVLKILLDHAPHDNGGLVEAFVNLSVR